MRKQTLLVIFLLSFVAALVIAVGTARSQGRGGAAAAAAVPQLQLRQVAYLKASNAEAHDHFACGGGNDGHNGDGIAISGDGNTMAIGAPYESGGARGVNGNQNDNAVYASGAVYVFTRQGNNWVQQAYVKTSNTGQSDHFGASVALSTDGNTMAVAATFEASAAKGVNGDQNDDSIPQAGAVYIFTRTGNTWSQQAYIKASNTGRAGANENDFGDGDQFAYSISLSDDGNTLAVGAITEDSAARGINGNQEDDSAVSAGAVYVFARAGTTWSQQAYLKPANLQGGDLFGFAVGLSADGNTLAASSFDEDGGARVIDGPDDNTRGAAGAVYVFTRTGSTWSQQAYLKGSRNERADQMGYSVAISDDGNTIATGAGDEDCVLPGVNPPGCDNDSPANIGANIWVGAAYVFVRNGNTWTEQAFIKATNPRPYNSYGVKLALSGDGNSLAVTAYLEDSGGQGVRGPELLPFLALPFLEDWRERKDEAEESGAVYFYTRTGTTWTPRAYIKGSNTQAGDEFGSAVALSRDGRIMAVGAHNEDSAAKGLSGNQADNSADDSGAAYIFTH
jgi:hypothetical protein